MTADRPHVLVTDAGRGSAVACIRSLGRRGWKVTAADHDRSSPGFRSRFVTARLVHPDPLVNADEVVASILRVARETKVDLIIPVTDEIGLPLAAARDAFEGISRLAIPAPEAMAVTHDKAATVALADRVGVPVPPTMLVSGQADGRAAARDLGYPIVIKPGVSRVVRSDGTIDRFAVGYAGDANELDRQLARVDPGTPVLLQRWLPGQGLGVEVLADEGAILAAFQHRRLREVPVTGGASALRESVPLDDDLFAYARRLIADLRWTGLAMVEFRRAPDGSASLMEINGRIWGSLPLAVRAGMDFPGRWADLLLAGHGAEVTPDTGYRSGVRARNLRLELAWIRAVLTGRHRHAALPWPPRRAALGAAASLLDPRIGDDLFTLGDPGPGLAQLVGIARDAVRAPKVA